MITNKLQINDICLHSNYKQLRYYETAAYHPATYILGIAHQARAMIHVERELALVFVRGRPAVEPVEVG
jgi:hypothetical protein